MTNRDLLHLAILAIAIPVSAILGAWWRGERVKEVLAEPQVTYVYIERPETEEDRITRLAVQMRLAAAERARGLNQ